MPSNALKSNQGFSMVSVVLALGFFTTAGVYVARTVSQNVKVRTALSRKENIQEIIKPVQFYATTVMINYLKKATRATPDCNAQKTPFAAEWTDAQLPQGIQLSLITPTTLESLPGANISEMADLAFECANNLSIKSDTDSLAQIRDFHFCVAVEATSTTSSVGKRLTAIGPMILQFNFSVKEMGKPNALTCNEIRNPVNEYEKTSLKTYALWATRPVAAGITPGTDRVKGMLSEYERPGFQTGLASFGRDLVGLKEFQFGKFFLSTNGNSGSAQAAIIPGVSTQALPVVGTFKADNLADSIGLYDRATGKFHLKSEIFVDTADIEFQFAGYSADALPLMGDWDGDGTDTPALYFPSSGEFSFKHTLTDGPAELSGVRISDAPNNLWPVAGDWDGNGTDEVGVFDRTTSTFYLISHNSTGPATAVFAYTGMNCTDCQPIAGDWDGDEKATVGMYSSDRAEFYLLADNSTTSPNQTVKLGPAGNNWVPMVGRWMGGWE